jgi:hypothetical protein
VRRRGAWIAVRALLIGAGVAAVIALATSLARR